MTVKLQLLYCGIDLIGYIAVTGSDHFHLFGSFTPGPDYAKYSHYLEQMQAYAAKIDILLDADDVDDDQEAALTHALFEVVYELDDLGLRLGEPGTAIRDFQLEHRNEVEFKYCF